MYRSPKPPFLPCHSKLKLCPVCYKISMLFLEYDHSSSAVSLQKTESHVSVTSNSPHWILRPCQQRTLANNSWNLTLLRRDEAIFQ